MLRIGSSCSRDCRRTFVVAARAVALTWGLSSPMGSMALAADERIPIPLISQPIQLTPEQAAWTGKVTLNPGLYRLMITYGKGGITNEGYPGFPGAPYSKYAEGRGSAVLRVRLDGREIAAVQVPPIPTEEGLARQAVIPFVCLAPGEPEIRLAATLAAGDGLEITQATLSPAQPGPVPHTLQQPRPGWPLMDLISWCEYVFYTRPPGHGPDDIRDQVLRPSWKVGFNMIWTVFNNASGTIPFPWDEQATGMPMPASYALLWSKDERWQVEGYRRYLHDVHDRNMMEMLYWYSPFPGVPVELAQPGQKASAVKTGDSILNSLLYDRRGLNDGISNERYCATNQALIGSRELALAHVNQLLESNPGAFAVNYISGVDSARAGMVGDLPSGLEPYSAGYFEGWDDFLVMAPDPWVLRAGGGKRYRWIEFWTEDGELIPEQQRQGASATDATWYRGHIGEDFIVKQMNDIARLRLLDPSQCNALTGVTWYTDGMVVSACNTEMAQAVCQDPVRGALAGQLRSLGQGGKVRSLYPYPTTSFFQQNNYVALFLPSGKPGGELFYDLQRTANFTPSSFRVPLAQDFLNTVGPWTTSQVSCDVLERGAYRSVVRSELLLESGETAVNETRTFELIADTPYLTVTIDDRSKGPNLPLTHLLGGEGYDQLVVAGEVIHKASSLPLPAVSLLRDSAGLKPDLVLLFLAAPADSTLVWEPSKSLMVQRPTAQRLRFVLAVPTNLYQQDQLQALGQHLRQPDPVLAWRDEPITVTNASSLPLTQVVALQGADERPYLVEEEGWWTFRGAQVSKQMPKTDLLKVYLQAGGSATILPWGLISGVVRPGWGCQYLIALGEVKATAEGGACRVKVLNETPMIFAPRVEFPWPIATAELNGQPWHYFEGSHVFLPQKRGEYQLKVGKGESAAPHLTRTFANIDSMSLGDNELVLEATAPPWRQRLPEGYRLTAQIEHRDRELGEITGGKLVRTVAGRSIIAIELGTVTIRFRQ